MTTIKQRVATLVVALMVAVAGAFAASATIAASDANANSGDTGDAEIGHFVDIT